MTEAISCDQVERIANSLERIAEALERLCISGEDVVNAGTDAPAIYAALLGIEVALGG